MTRCLKCKKEAAYYRPYSGEHLCRRHFLESIDRKVARTIARHKMLKETDRIGVGISGGKDSTVLLHILKKVEERFSKSSLLAITIDEGIKGYRDESLKLATQIASDLEIEHHVMSFKDLYGYSLDEIVEIYNKKSEETHTACFFCGILRRRALNQMARELKVDKLAIGHNLDDEAQTVLMNVFRSDVLRMGRTNLDTRQIHDLFVTRVKPLREIPEREIAAYAFFRDLPFHSQTCPYAEGVLRNDIQQILNDMEQKRPGTKHSVLRSGDKIQQYLQIKQEIHPCPVCHEPATEKICKFCQLMQDLQGFSSKKI
ncbi:MAG: TIGR00269 family protein [Candidatus Helarchaeota archaeon]|nr:TIGR00269 family protein [Candidatus Helarchaeota archaeon]